MVNKENFTIDDSKNLLELIRTKLSKNDRNNRLIYSIVIICHKGKYKIIEDISYAKKLWNDLQNSIHYSHYHIVYLWAISAQSPQQYYYDIIINTLKEKFDYQLYKFAIMYEIIDYKLFFKELVAYANKYIIPSSKIEHGTTTNHMFQDFIDLLYNARINSNEPILNKLKNLDDFMKFYIFRDKYDFKNFEISWLYLFEEEDNIIFEELSKIGKLKQTIKKHLKIEYSEKLGKIYTKYFI